MHLFIIFLCKYNYIIVTKFLFAMAHLINVDKILKIFVHSLSLSDWIKASMW